MCKVRLNSSSGHGFRICHYSIQGNHLHLICEATDERLLARGVQGFSSLVARRINRLLGRRGKVFADRYHCRALATPRSWRRIRYASASRCRLFSGATRAK